MSLFKTRCTIKPFNYITTSNNKRLYIDIKINDYFQDPVQPTLDNVSKIYN